MLKTAIALGNFDGLHLGHLAVINGALDFAENGFIPTVLLLDYPPSATAKALMLKGEKEKSIKQLGLQTVNFDFEEIKNYSPQRFFKEILVDKLNAGAISCGFNYRFGKNAAGDTELLQALCNEAGVQLKISEPITLNGETISSTKIRSFIEQGDMLRANEMLGREFSYCLEVVHGDKIGRTIGCPTINQLLPCGFIVPKYGVYRSVTEVDGKLYRSVTNIGIRPSFESDQQRSETNIIGFNGDLYGRFIEVRLQEYKRGEKKFNTLDELKAQLDKDRE